MRLALPLSPVIDQAITKVPLTIWSAAGFALAAMSAFLVAWRRTAWILGLLVISVPFAFYRDIDGTTITASKALLVGAAVGLIIRGTRIIPASTAARRLLIAAIAVAGTTLLSAAHATFLWATFREALKQAQYVALAWCAISVVEFDREVGARAFSWGLVVALLATSAYAIAQAIVGGAPSGIVIDHHRIPRVAGPLEGPNQLAGFLEAAIPVAWLSPVLMSGRLAPLRSGVIGAAIAALVLSQSRAGMLVVVAAFVAFWFIDRRGARASFVPSIVGALTGIGILALWYGHFGNPLLALERFFTLILLQAPGAVGTRSELWIAAIALFKRQVISGVGAGNFELLLLSVGLRGVRTHANSLWLQTLAEQGVVGLIAMLSLAIVSLREAYRGIRTSWLARAAFLATASLFAHQFVDDLFFFPKVGMLWWLLIGAATGSVPRADQAAQKKGIFAQAEPR